MSRVMIKTMRRGRRFAIFALAMTAAALCSPSRGAAQAANGPDASGVMAYLNQAVTWYRQFAAQQQIALKPSDVVFVYDNHQLADQAIQQAFAFARAQAAAIQVQGKPDSAQAANTQYDALRKLKDTLDKQLHDTQAESDSDKKRLATATGKQHQELQDQVAELDGEIALAAARRDATQSMLEFVNETASEGGNAGLKAQIDALAESVPVAATGASGTATPNPAPSGSSANPVTGNQSAAAQGSQTLPALTASSVRPDTTHLWDLVANLFALSRKVSTIDTATLLTDRLLTASNRIRMPLVAHLKDMSQQGDQLANAADTATPAQLAAEKQQLDSLAKQFKQLADAFIPLNKEVLVLGLYKRSLDNWKESVRGEQKTELLDLLVRVISLAVFLVVVFGVAELWRRAIVRYVHDPRRLHQFLLLRKFVLWSFVAMVVTFSFANSLGSLATFAGLLTAGVAVALQSVILSVVGYFFLIGKYGLRVGDRVRIGDVNGQVIEMGLVRFHLMELGGAGDTPTGRTIAFSNSIMFQSGPGISKQIPGTSFGWHEITLTLAPNVDYGDIRKKLLAGVNAALADYREEMENQNRSINDFAATSAKGLQPTMQAHFASSGLEVVIRFPVTSQHASEIDARVSQAVRKVLDRESKSSHGSVADSDIKVSPSAAPIASGTPVTETR